MKNIGIEVQKITKSCTDKKCPFHGTLKVRGRILKGTIVGKDVHKSATLEFTRRFYVPKYERYEKRKTRIRVHNPTCVDAQKGDFVKVSECRKLSKSKSFVIIEKLGRDILFKQKEELLEESKVKKEEKTEQKEETQDESR